ncbi:MAG TPA: GntR family transcriptional regulator [Stellaceae bacterium]|jgi:DNA-binding GntR family transcriptional regulator|nr:GntR family transcriptional regulator [Stellaceae bacterium]
MQKGLDIPEPRALAISRTNLHAEVTSRLRALIIDGAIPPGARLNERLLCTELQVSRTPLREALKVLAAEGLAELLPNRGAIVTPVSIAEIDHVFEVLAPLEGVAGQLAAERINEAQLAEIRTAHVEMLVHHDRRNRAEYFRCNQAIHEAISRAAANPVLLATYGALNARVRRARYFANVSQERWDKAVAEHEQILEALERRDGERLRWILERHLRNKRDVVIAAIEARLRAQAAEEAGLAPRALE